MGQSLSLNPREEAMANNFWGGEEMTCQKNCSDLPSQSWMSEFRSQKMEKIEAGFDRRTGTFFFEWIKALVGWYDSLPCYLLRKLWFASDVT